MHVKVLCVTVIKTCCSKCGVTINWIYVGKSVVSKSADKTEACTAGGRGQAPAIWIV